MITKGMMSSLRSDWRTPKKFLEELTKEFGETNFKKLCCPQIRSPHLQLCI